MRTETVLKGCLPFVFFFAVVSCKNPPQEEALKTVRESNTELVNERTPEPTLLANKVEPKCPHALTAHHDCPHTQAQKPNCPHAAESHSDCSHTKSEGQKAHDCPYHKEGQEGSVTGTSDTKGQVHCPVGGEVIEDISKAYKSEYKGKTYYFGCEGCKAKFNSNPEKYAGE
ncbi:MAG: YHS domain-containing protein [Syntrophaceae bacterium]|nr:YHS domain-containing protein [Syntrophaceae bacterium]